MNLLLVTLCGLWCHVRLSNAQADYMEPEPEYEGYQHGDQFQKLHKDGHQDQDTQEFSKDVEPDDNDPNLMEQLQPYINRGPPTRGETYKYAATMYTHLYLTRKTSPRTKRTKAPITPTVLWDQYFIRNRLKANIRVHHIKAHYHKEYRTRLKKMVDHCCHSLLFNCTNYTRDDLMDEYRAYREEQMIRADDRLFNKYVRRMDTVLQSGRYEKWNFHLNTTHKPRFNHEQNLLFTDRVDKKMILEIRSLARSLRKDVHRYFDILDNQFLKVYFRIPYNVSLYYRYPQCLNYTEQF
ncbi:hypothetical protein M8J76_010874 [Diaphorina citri]|nr:hypothetical protein M8J75_015206 [Diaphorina citri]KAI5723780.1 hypothetical protein M8J76_010874 [Diaphorina citri]KAI5729007.1 hypothetical protein M8J77_024125 [Diaphorina citri]